MLKDGCEICLSNSQLRFLQVSFLLRQLSHEEQHGSHRLLIPKLGFIGLAWEGQSLTQLLWPVMPCLGHVQLWRQGWHHSYLNHKCSPQRNEGTVPSSKGAMKTGQGRCNHITVDVVAFLRQGTSQLTGKGAHTLDFSPKGDFFLNCVKPAILFQSVWSNQMVSLPSWENLREEFNILDFSEV